MTGEITLHGNVLAIGGLREKSMAAYREGMKIVLMPKDNESDLYEVDDEVKENLEFVPVSNLEQVLRTALSAPGAAPARPRPKTKKRPAAPVPAESNARPGAFC